MKIDSVFLLKILNTMLIKPGLPNFIYNLGGSRAATFLNRYVEYVVEATEKEAKAEIYIKEYNPSVIKSNVIKGEISLWEIKDAEGKNKSIEIHEHPRGWGLLDNKRRETEVSLNTFVAHLKALENKFFQENTVFSSQFNDEAVLTVKAIKGVNQITAYIVEEGENMAIEPHSPLFIHRLINKGSLEEGDPYSSMIEYANRYPSPMRFLASIEEGHRQGKFASEVLPKCLEPYMGKGPFTISVNNITAGDGMCNTKAGKEIRKRIGMFCEGTKIFFLPSQHFNIPTVIADAGKKQPSIYHPSGFFEYCREVEECFKKIAESNKILVIEIEMILNVVVGGNKSTAMVLSYLNMLKAVLYQLYFDKDGVAAPFKFNAFTVFEALFLILNGLDVITKDLQKKKINDSPLESLRNIIFSRLKKLIYKALEELFPFAYEVYNYEKKLLPRAKVNELPDLMLEEKLGPPLPPLVEDVEEKKVKKKKNMANSVGSKVFQGPSGYIQEVEVEQPQSGIPKKKKKTKSEEDTLTKKEKMLEEIKAERERELEEARNKKFSRGEPLALSKDQMEALMKNLSKTNHDKLNSLFNKKLNHYKFTTEQVEALAKDIKEILVQAKSTSAIGEAFLHDVVNHKHYAHKSTDTGKQLSSTGVEHLLFYFIQHGVFPRKEWIPQTPKELRAYEQFLNRITGDEEEEFSE